MSAMESGSCGQKSGEVEGESAVAHPRYELGGIRDGRRCPQCGDYVRGRHESFHCYGNGCSSLSSITPTSAFLQPHV